MLTIYNKKGAAKALGISTETIDRYRKNGKLPHRKIGDRIIFTESDLIQFLDSCSIPSINVPSNKEKLEISKAAIKV